MLNCVGAWLAFDEQWVKINNIYRANIHEEDEGFTTSDEDDSVTEDGIEDNVDDKQVEAKVTEDGVENSPGVISDSNELECDDKFLDTQYRIDNEETGDQEGTRRGSTEEGENEVEYDAQSLGLNSSPNEIEQIEEDAQSVTEEQRDAKRGLGM